MKYLGHTKTSFLDDRAIRAKDFTKWRQAHDKFRHGTGRDTVEKYKAEIKKWGAPQRPLLLDLDDKSGENRVYLGDGHHRAVALTELGVEEFPFHWRRISKWGWFSLPPLERAPFPYHLLETAASRRSESWW